MCNREHCSWMLVRVRRLGLFEWKVLSIVDTLLNKLLELLNSLRLGENSLQTAKDSIDPTEDAPKQRHQPAADSGLRHYCCQLGRCRLSPFACVVVRGQFDVQLATSQTNGQQLLVHHWACLQQFDAQALKSTLNLRPHRSGKYRHRRKQEHLTISDDEVQICLRCLQKTG